MTQAATMPTCAMKMMSQLMKSVVATRNELEKSSLKARQAEVQKPRPSMATSTYAELVR